ncbi:MAG: hypothetical protein IJE27_02675 [Anaerotignum sp.]|nr:hypothetical protein [Anaerotignum sp.]
MATFTENYSLIKPDGEDYYDVADFNENMDTLDAVMAAAEGAVSEVSAKIGTPPAAGQTVFSLLTRGDITFASLFKSVQRVSISSPDTSVSIQTVDPAKCLVFVERIYNQTEALRSYEYILHADHIEMTSFSGANKDVTLAFNIIEFY